MSRFGRRLGAALLGAVVGMAVAGVAFAHVEVEAEPAVGGATNALVSFSAEAESNAAGIKSVQIVLPSSIPPSSVTVATMPSGWTFAANADGYTIAGPARPTGEDVKHSIRVATLPNVEQLVFKALVTYGNNAVDRWIEEPTTANPNPEHPAPILKLAAGSGPAPTTGAPTVTATAPSPAVAATPAAASSGGVPVWVWVLVAAVAIAAIAGGLVLARRRHTP